MKKKMGLRISGGVLAAVGLLIAVFTRNAAVSQEAQTGNKLLFAFSLILLITGTAVFLSSFHQQSRSVNVKKLAMASMLTALCYVGFAFFKIDIPVPGSTERTAFHLGNVFCVLAALLTDGLWGGFAGAIGMTLGDLFTGYITSAPKTFLLKLCIGLITGVVAHRVLRLRQEQDPKKVVWKAAVSAGAGMLFNVIADPIVGYFYKRYLFGLPQDWAAALAKVSAGTTMVNAVVAVVVSTVFYTALRPVLKRSGLIGENDGFPRKKG